MNSNDKKTASLPTGIVLSGGGARAAYQIGILRALANTGVLQTENISVIVGTSVGAINGIVLSGCLGSGLHEAVEAIADVWRERTYRNTFSGHISHTFVRTLKVAFLRYSAPGPVASSVSIFNPTPLQDRINQIIAAHGNVDIPTLKAVAVMTTIEGEERLPLLLARTRKRLDQESLDGANFEVCYLKELQARHGLASAALPSVLPPVTLDLENRNVRLVDGGICDNHPVDPAVRLGAERIFILDCSGRRWWFDHYDEPHYTKPTWQVSAVPGSYCLVPEEIVDFHNSKGLGHFLKLSLGRSTKDYIMALGPTWPIFKILKHRLGEDLAYEVMSYVTLHPDFAEALLEYGYNDGMAWVARTFAPTHEDNCDDKLPSAKPEAA